ncbi:MAG: hypothetical protein A2061_09080 [Gallionellales bacterium GWA2_59_43]|nr:MAG: hypothetical protein A2061_09080 [Gallionellales bacterium GWA2_59_43]
MKQDDYAKAVVWLKTNPTFDELCARYPQDWDAVQSDIATIVQSGVPEELKRYLDRLSSKTGQLSQRDAVLSQFVRSRMAHEAVKKLSLSALAADTGIVEGKLRFNWFNGFIAQRLLFARELERKPVSLSWFRLFWPLVWQRKHLMPLVQPRGIYCFYTRELVDELAVMIASRSCLEIGAGDGTLTRFLQARGVQITATDNHGWNNSVTYPDWVVKLDACAALNSYKPEVVICSWPPAQNEFERCVFDMSSVQLYIVIGSRHRFAFGNWETYRNQQDFELVELPHLATLLLPPELESAVFVFERKKAN